MSEIVYGGFADDTDTANDEWKGLRPLPTKTAIVIPLDDLAQLQREYISTLAPRDRLETQLRFFDVSDVVEEETGDDDMPKFRRKPSMITAEQFHDAKTGQNTLEWIRGFPFGVCLKGCDGCQRPHVHTMHEGQIVSLQDKDWVVPEPDGEHYYPIKDSVMQTTYDQVED